jgi:GMP synthase PP-ATPase subunit
MGRVTGRPIPEPGQNVRIVGEQKRDQFASAWSRPTRRHGHAS